MGGNSSRRRKPTTPIPTYVPPAGTTPGITRPGVAITPAVGTTNIVNRDQQRELMQLNQQVANLNAQIQAMQRGGAVGGTSMPYGGYPQLGGMPYGTPPMIGQYSGGSPPPSPLLQHFGGQNPYSYQSPGMMGGGAGNAVYRDTDFGAIANIAGLNPADVAILHREFMNLTRGGTSKIDRVIFRQLLRDVLLQANNEHVDRVIENMFVTIDRNHDGFIDFPEFIGAFKDVLKERPSDPQSYYDDHVYPDILTDQLRASGVGTGIMTQPISYGQQAQPLQFVSNGGLNIVPLASAGVQQVPVMFGGGGATSFQIADTNPPMLTLDPNESSYVIATPGQYLITQPTAIQYVPLPMM